MINIQTQPPPPSVAARPREGWAKPLSMLVLALGTLTGSACFRATGIQRSPMAAEVIPETGGDRVPGLKAKGGSGDLYLGNDFIQIVVDGAVPANPSVAPLAGAAAGGSIIDAGYLQLDASFARVSTPGTAMHRLTPVVNQDPRLQMSFDTITPGTEEGLAVITMAGGLLDPDNVLGTGAGPVPGVSVTHKITVAQLERFFTLTTTVTNTGASPLPILSIGDCLAQEGGGYRFAVPASHDYLGDLLPLEPAAVTDPWGVQIPQTDFTHPLVNSVQAPMVGLMDTEPGADTLDSHASLGILPVDADRLLVAADAQDLLTVDAAHLRPAFPARLVAGSLPAPQALAGGASLSYTRRLYIAGGTSVAGNYPSQATGLFNAMETDRHIGNVLDAALRPHDAGVLSFTLSGTSVRQGPRPTEVRIERQAGTDGSGNPVWQLERVEWFEPNENLFSASALAPSTLQVVLPVGIYRMVLRNQDAVQTRTSFENAAITTGSNGNTWQDLSGPIWIQKGQAYIVSPDDVLCPDAIQGNPNLVGPVTNNPYSAHYFQTRELNALGGNLQPLRITLVGTPGTGTAAPVLRRQRTLASFFDAEVKGIQVAGPSVAGQYQFRGGNQLFGTGFARLAPAEFVWLPNPPSGSGSTLISAYGTRGPLSKLERLDLEVFDGQTQTSHEFIVTPMGLPPGWTSFDLPGPSLATTGGMLPGEQLASAMAEGIQVVGATEQDRQVDAAGLYQNFMTEFGFTNLVAEAQRPASLSAITRPVGFPYGSDPFVVGARSSALAGYGTVSALFTPAPSGARMGGTPASSGWVLADFLAQAQGQYNVVHRPRAPLPVLATDPPAGLFTLLGAPAGAAWMRLPGTLSLGQVNGGFDALELLRGESLDPAHPELWFQEFLAVRSDWFGLLATQTPAAFTKALGLSSARYSIDTPVGLARTYLKASPVAESDLSGVLGALRKGAAVASTGPFLDVSVGAYGPGDLVPGPVQTLPLVVNLWKSDWMPVHELRVVVNGTAQAFDLVANPGLLTPSASDPRLYTGTFQVDLTGLTSDAWVVVEAGVSLASPPAAGPYSDPAIDAVSGAGFVDRWNAIMRGIYPIAVTNPIFVNVTGSASYIPPAAVAAALQ